MKNSVVSCFIFLLFIFIFPAGAEEIEAEYVTAEQSADESTTDVSIIVESAAEEEISEVVTAEKSVSDDDFFFDDDFFYFEAPDLVIEVPPYEMRSLDEIFPRINRRIATNGTGYRYSFENGESPSLVPLAESGIDLYSEVMKKNPSHLIEALVVVPYNQREFDMLDIYNALGRIENIKDQTLPTRSGGVTTIFKETTRLVSAQNRRPVPDPEPSSTLPFSDTIYLRFTDSFIGSLFIRGDMTLNYHGITYNMTNFRDINFSVFRVMKAEQVSIIIYLEPVKEGVLIYSVSGLNLPGFIVRRMNLTPNINARIRVLIDWITEGLRSQESIAIDKEREDLIKSILHNNRINRMVRENTGP